MFRFVRKICTSPVMPFYAVHTGRRPGIYFSWDECKEQVVGFPKARYKKFDSRNDAEEFVHEDGCSQSKVDTSLGVKKQTTWKAKGGLLGKRSAHCKVDKENYIMSAVSVINCPLECRKCIKVINYLDDSSAQVKQKPKQTKLISQEDTIKHTFIKRENLPTSAVVYTDGCCLNNGKKHAIQLAGVGVYWAPHHPKNVSEPLISDNPSNQKAELTAAIKALETAIEMGLTSIEMRTDSEYTIKAMTEWIHNWESNGWKTGRNKTVENKELMVRLAALCKRVNITWVHVDAHVGIYGNEEADRLAREGALKPIHP